VTREQQCEQWAREATTSELVLYIAKHTDDTATTEWVAQQRHAYEAELDRRIPRPAVASDEESRAALRALLARR
jgi:hypothetical protein